MKWMACDGLLRFSCATTVTAKVSAQPVTPVTLVTAVSKALAVLQTRIHVTELLSDVLK